MRHTSLFAVLVSVPALAGAQGARPASTAQVPAAMSAITEADLKRDLYQLAGDAMRGRRAGTLDEMRASMWVADQLRKIGVQPMGEDGTYFQWWSLRRTRIGSGSTVRVGDRSFTVWTDVVARGNNVADVSGTAVWAGNGSDTTLDVRGKIAIVEVTDPGPNPNARPLFSPEYQYANFAATAKANAMAQRGAIGVILVADEMTDKAFNALISMGVQGGQYTSEGTAGRGGRGAADPLRPFGTGAACGGPPVQPDTTTGGRGGRGGGAGGGGGRGNAGAGQGVPSVVVRRSTLDELRAANGKPATIRLVRETFTYPSVNIIGVVRGSDPQLRNEYVLYSSHQDHDGVLFDMNGDSTWNGADDNGSVSVALLAAARAFVKQPAKRSVLFVYHGAEERGLVGSRYYVQHPIVPLAQTVAVLNGDMIGRNHPDSASIMGVQPPHRNSSDLVAMALRANDLTGKFKLDSLWDRPTHREGWYRRSDHLPYAEACVPAIEYSTNLHPDYHTARDNPENINYPKLTRMAQWMYLTGWFVANADKRPALEPAFDTRR